MKGNIAVQTQTKEKLQDEGKLAYMIAWRDKRIAALQELVQTQEQARKIYAAYVAYLLSLCAHKTDAGLELRVSKADIREACGKYAVHAEDADEDFIITLEKMGESDGAGRSEMADA